MIKLTVLYGHPTSPEAFEKYYAEKHFEKVNKVSGIAKLELTKMVSGPEGGAAAFYRMADLYFTSQEAMQQTLGSPEGQAMAADLPNFATGGVTIMIGAVED